MKHILKKVVLFIYLCLVTITISCETEKEVLETTKQPIVKARKEIFKSLRENDTFNKVYLKLETQRQIAVTNRSSMEDLYNFSY